MVRDSSKISERGIEGAPDLVFEISGPRTASKDILGGTLSFPLK